MCVDEKLNRSRVSRASINHYKASAICLDDHNDQHEYIY